MSADELSYSEEVEDDQSDNDEAAVKGKTVSHDKNASGSQKMEKDKKKPSEQVEGKQEKQVKKVQGEI